MKLTDLMEALPPGKAFSRHFLSHIKKRLTEISYASSFARAAPGEKYWKYDDVDIHVQNVLLVAEKKNEDGIATELFASILVSFSAHGIYTAYGHIPGGGSAQAVESNFGDGYVVVSLGFDLSNVKSVAPADNVVRRATFNNRLTGPEAIGDKSYKLYRQIDDLNWVILRITNGISLSDLHGNVTADRIIASASPGNEEEAKRIAGERDKLKAEYKAIQDKFTAIGAEFVPSGSGYHATKDHPASVVEKQALTYIPKTQDATALHNMTDDAELKAKISKAEATKYFTEALKAAHAHAAKILHGGKFSEDAELLEFFRQQLNGMKIVVGNKRYI